MRLSNLSLDRCGLLQLLQIALMVFSPWPASCGSQSLPEPVLEQVCLSSDQPGCIKIASAGSQVEIVFRGKHFYPLYQVSLDNQNEPPTLGEFKAWVGTLPILQLSQEPKKDRGRHTLTGFLQTSQNIGLHDARLELPSGLQLLLKNAFRISSFPP